MVVQFNIVGQADGDNVDFRLEKMGNTVRLRAQVRGDDDTDAVIRSLEPGKPVELWADVPEELGIPLGSDGYVKIRHE